VGFVSAVKKALVLDFFNFKGRASRSEFWWFQLFVILTEAVFSILIAILPAVLGNTGAKVGIVLFVILLNGIAIPTVAVTVRRLHDLDRSGRWLLLAGVPIIGPILLLVWWCTRGSPGPNSYGDA